MTDYHLAQINIARFRVAMDDPVNAGFVNSLDRINARADASPGFIWRLAGDTGNATDILAYDDPNIAVNMSVWQDIDSLTAFTFRDPSHLDIMRRRREWFEKMEFFMVLWWVPVGHVPTLAEGKARLETLRQKGPTPQAFTFRNPFAPPGGDDIAPILDSCA